MESPGEAREHLNVILFSGIEGALTAPDGSRLLTESEGSANVSRPLCERIVLIQSRTGFRPSFATVAQVTVLAKPEENPRFEPHTAQRRLGHAQK